MPTEPGTLGPALTGQLPLIVLVAVILAAAASALLLRAYRRAVIRSMRTASGGAKLPPQPPPTSSPVAAPIGPLRVETLDGSARAEWSAPAAELHAAGRRARHRNLAVHALASAAFAAVISVCWMLGAGGISPLRALLVFWTAAWPGAVVLGWLLAAGGRERAIVLGAYAGVWLVMASVAVALSPGSSLAGLMGLWMILNIPATILLLGFMRRRVRAVGPLVLAFMVAGVFGANLAVSVAAGDDRILWQLVGAGVAVGLGAAAILAAIVAFGFAVLGVVGWWALRGIGLLYDRRRISDQTVMADAVHLLFAVVAAVLLAFNGAVWVLGAVVAFGAYRLVATVGFATVAREKPSGPTPRLLLLRVFALGRRSERLFDALGARWRHAGTIRLIAGPDLATTTVEPHEFLDFVGGRLSRRFIDGPATLEQRLAETTPAPDPDGRHRVHDFFCYDDAWRMVLTRLVQESDAVLMDLRGFSRQNAGCLWEIEELLNVAPLERVVILVDRTTDETFLRESVASFWNALRPDSPNRSPSGRRLVIHRSTGSEGRDGAALMAELCAAARPSRVESSMLNFQF
jgi:hypothetical protein